MNIIKMQYFIAVAENGGFTKAAKHCYISQTAISQQIASMENEMEVSLFDRRQYGVELTASGKSFLKDCKTIVALYEGAVKRAQALSKGLEGILRIGIIGQGNQNFLSPILNGFHEKYPNVEFIITQNCLLGLIEKLEADVLDIILTFSYDLVLMQNLNRIPMMCEELGLVVSKQHRFAVGDQVEASEVAGERIIMISREFSPEIYEHIMENCKKDGYEPQIIEIADYFDVLMLMVSANKGVAFLPKRIADAYSDTVHFVKVNGTHHSNEFDLAWKKTNENPIVKAFAGIAKDYISIKNN